MHPPKISAESQRTRLELKDLRPDPIDQFNLWLGEAIAEGVQEPTAMSLATAVRSGLPLLRTVLLKGLDQRGFVFFTNLESRKARHLHENPTASLLFPWAALNRQVIVTGNAEKVPTLEALTYFMSRPRESQLAAWASQQSNAISSRKVLELQWAQIKEKFGRGKIPLPAFWGGYRIQPQTIEFWQGGSHWLHDRFEYTRRSRDGWAIQRLSP